MTADLDASMASLRLLHDQCARKQQQIQNLQGEEHDLHLQFEGQIERHARADCKQLANMMHTKLPQELRDLVYQNLYLEDAPVPVGSYHFTTYVPEPLRSENNPPAHSEPFVVIPEGGVKQDHSLERDENVVYPDSRLLDPGYLGYPVAREASRYYYKSNTFSVCTLENAIHDFLFRDPIHNFDGRQEDSGSAEPLGFLPVDHIRNLQIRVKYEHYETYRTFYKTLHDGEKNLIRGIFDTLREFTSRLSPTIASQLQIEFCIMTAYKSSDTPTNPRARSHINLLEAVRVPIHTLTHDLGATIKVVHYDEHLSPFPKNIAPIFTLSKEKWSKESSAYADSGIEYSPLHCYVAQKAVWKGSEGFSFFELDNLVFTRWALRSAFDTLSGHQPIEGDCWPMGRTTPWDIAHHSALEG